MIIDKYVFGQAQVVSDPNADYKYCKYDSDVATGYGIGAFFCLLASQVIVMVASRCFCCGQALSPGGSRACAVILFIVCWYADSFHFFYLVKQNRNKFGPSSCHKSLDRSFSAFCHC